MPRQKEVYVVIPIRSKNSKGGGPQIREARNSSKAAEVQTPGSKHRKRSASPLPPRQNKRKKPQSEIKVGATSLAPEQPRIVASKASSLRNSDSISREARLRSEPYAEVKSPTLVVCRLCGTQIRLSDKETHGLSKWNRHRKRCKVQAEENTDDVEARPNTLNTRAQSQMERIAVPTAGSSALKLRIRRPGRRMAVSHPIERPDDILSLYNLSLFTARRDEPVSDRPTESTLHHPPELDKHLPVSDVAPTLTATDQHEDQQSGMPISNAYDREMRVDRFSAASPHEMYVEDKITSVALHTPVDIDHSADDQLSDVEMSAEIQRIDNAEVESQLFDASQSILSPGISSLSPGSTSEIELEYPDWVPPSSSGSFEHELRAAGMNT